MKIERVITYIDGFNLYYGLRAAGLRSSRWLDLVALSRGILKPEQRIKLVRYFTTRVRRSPQAQSRQSTYIDALEARGGISIDYGYYLSKSVECHNCQHGWETHEEKKTDANIAVRLLEEAFDDLFDVAIVISGDSDLTPPIKAIRHRFSGKKVVAAFPPERRSQELVLTLRQHSASLRRLSGTDDYRIRSSRSPVSYCTHLPAGYRRADRMPPPGVLLAAGRVMGTGH